MKPNEFFEESEKAFASIITRYGLVVTDRKRGKVSWECVLKNSTTGIVAIHEIREMYVRVLICQLVEDKIVRMTGEIRQDTPIFCYDLEDLLSLREPKQGRPVYEVTNLARYGLPEILQQYARDIEGFGADVLQGKFNVFPSLETFVKDRAKAAAFQKWGDQAHQFGW